MLKKIVKYSLIAVGFTLYFVGMGVMIDSNSKVDENVENKEELIAQYKVSQEYRDTIDEKVDAYYDALQSGALTTDEYEEKMRALTTDEFAEYCLLQSQNLEDKNKLIKYNKQIDKNITILGSQIATMVGGVAGISAGLFMDER